MARNKKAVEQVDFAVSTKERLETTIASVKTQLEASRQTKDTATTNANEWKSRVEYATEMIESTDEPDAIEALEILKAQAESYYETYSTAAVADDDYIGSLSLQLEKLQKTLASLDLIDKKKELTEHLRSIASGMNNPSAKAISQKPDHSEAREIESLILTANALIEVKTGKAA